MKHKCGTEKSFCRLRTISGSFMYYRYCESCQMRTDPKNPVGIRVVRAAGFNPTEIPEVESAVSKRYDHEGRRIGSRGVESPKVLELRSMPYADYLKTAHWQRIRCWALRKAFQRCQVCNGKGLLDVHHRTYERRGRERLADVTVLCRECHTLYHKGPQA